MSGENKAIFDCLNQAFSDGAFDRLNDLVAPDFIGHSPLSPEPMQGAEGLKAFFRAFNAAMPGIHHPI